MLKCYSAYVFGECLGWEVNEAVSFETPPNTSNLLIWVLPPPPSNSWIMSIIWLYIALNRTPSIDCGGAGQYPIF